MIKIWISLLFASTFAFSVAPKANGCDLSQVGNVEFTLGSSIYKKANYKAIASSGKNFKAIFVGSTIQAGDTIATIVAIKSYKREKKRPRRGEITLNLQSEKVTLNYIYDKGDFRASGILKDGTHISFALQIKALLCHVKI